MNKKLLQILQISLTIALVVFIVLKADDFFDKVDWTVIGNNWLAIIIASGFFILGYIFMAHHWLLVCRIIDPKTNPKQWLAYFASQPYKYLPTSLFTFSSRATFASKFGMDLKQSSQAQLIENFNLIGSALLTGGVLLLVISNIWLSSAVIIMVIVFLATLWQKRFFTIPKLKVKIDLRRWLASLAVVTTGWLVIGLGFLTITFAMEGHFEPILAVAANNIATGLGIVAIFAPGGIGVRELVFSYLGFASGTILVWRLITFIIDIVVGVYSAYAISRSR